MSSDDTYNDDLAWILEKLADRAGAHFGLILRFAHDDADALLLASSPPSLAPAPELIATLHAECRDQPAQDAGHADARLLLQCAWDGHGVMFLRFQPDPGTTIVVAVGRFNEGFGVLHRTVAEKLHPVLDRYIRLWWLHRCERRRVAALECSMDLCDLGVLFLDQRGRMTFANRFARELMERREGIMLVQQSLAAANADEGLRLQAALQHALHGNAKQGLAAPAGADAKHRAVMLSLRRARRRALIVTVVSFESMAIDQDDTAAILYVVDPEADVSPMLAPACRLYRLAPSESRLVSSLVGGATLTEASTQMGVSLETARGYLKQVFHKTDTNRQADLLRVMLGSASRTRVGLDLSML